MLVNILMSVVITLFADVSVSTTQRSFSSFVNPSGIAISPGLELSYLGSFSDIDTSHTIGLSLGNLGFGTVIRGEQTSYVLSSGARICNWLHMGYGYKFGDTKGYLIGTTVRPHRFLSLGFVGDKIGDNFLLKSGIGIRPGTDRITLSFDYNYNVEDESSDYFVGLKVEPVDGIFIEGYGNEDVWNAGISISFGNIGLGGRYGKNDDNETYNAGLVLSNEKYPTFMKPKPCFAELKIEGSYPELKRSQFLFEKIEAPFYKLLSQIKELSEDDACKGLVLELKGSLMHMSKWEEIRNELSRFKASGKKIYIYSLSYGLGSLYLSSIADSIFVHPVGKVVIPGIQIRRIYFKGTMEKIGVEAQVEGIGRFKSTPETFERKDMSEEDSLQIIEYLEDVYYPTIEIIAEARGMSTDSLQKLIDEGIFFNSDGAIEARLVDAALEKQDLDSLIGSGARKFKKEKIVGREWRKGKKKIALVIADGNIIRGKSSQGYMGSDDMVKTLEGIRDDEDVKAVVLRVNSGGGDALASELITNALRDISKDKPVIISMGGVAGSGGYVISIYGDKIFSDNTTLTGSIGVFWINFIFKELYDKIGISWDIVKLGKHADIMSEIHKWDEYERERIKKSVEWYYDRFINLVASERDTSKEYIHSIGEGRIWSGIKAKELGLIDEIGGLLDALDEAQRMADIKERDVDIYPKPKTGFSLGMMGSPFDLDNYLSSIRSLLSSEYLYMIPYILEVKER